MSDEVVSTMTSGMKYERQHLAHFIDTSFGGTANYARLGRDLDDYSVEMNPDVETKKNIIGEQSVNVKGYEPQASVDPYYAYKGEALFTALYNNINSRATGSALRTTVIDALIEPNSQGGLTVVSAYKEDVVVVPKSMGGADGIQIPFDVYYTGNRTAVSGTISAGIFTISA